MRIRQWSKESKELSDERMDMLTDRFTAKDLIHYRDNYARNVTVIKNMVLVITAVFFAAMILLCILDELSFFSERDFNLYFGYLFGLSIGLILFGCPSGKYTRKLTEKIEEKCLRELEEKK